MFLSGFVIHVVFKYPKITRRKKEQNAGMNRTALPFQKTKKKRKHTQLKHFKANGKQKKN